MTSVIPPTTTTPTKTTPASPTTTTPSTTTPSTTAGATSSSSSSGSSGTDGLAQLTQNFQTFLTLLTTQLKNQDPLSPLDSNQFTQQLVQMSGVEAQLSGNDLLKQVVTNTGASVGSAVGLIGKDVRDTSARAQLTGNGNGATWIYNLPTAAANSTLQVVNAAGQVVAAQAATDNSAGDHTFTWNGKDLSGNPLPAGAYTLQVTAADTTGKAITPGVFVDGVVTAVEQQNGTTLLTINGGQVPIANVVNVTTASTTSTTPSTATASSQNPLSSLLSSASSALGL